MGSCHPRINVRQCLQVVASGNRIAEWLKEYVAHNRSLLSLLSVTILVAEPGKLAGSCQKWADKIVDMNQTRINHGIQRIGGFDTNTGKQKTSAIFQFMGQVACRQPTIFQ